MAELKKWIIRWNAGYGDDYDCVEFETEDEADHCAYESWRDAVESDADYEAVPWTQDLAEDCGLDD